MALPTNAILIWNGANNAIPSGYTRETSLDGKFPKGAPNATNPNVTGGNATHTHTSPAHSHTMVDHTHTYHLPQYSGSTEDEGDGSGGNRFSDEVHTHGGTSGSVSGGTLTDGFTLGAGSNNPPYHHVIFIRATQPSLVPDGVAVLRNDTELPNGFFLCDGNNSTPNLIDKYLRGAPAGEDAGTTGGSLTHTHDYSHGHTTPVHSHVTASSGLPTNGQSGTNQDGSGNGASGFHTHAVWLDNTSTPVNTATGTFTSGDVEPVHRSLRAIMNKSGALKNLTKGDIALWLGELDDIPRGWQICDGTDGTPDMRDRFMKVKTTPNQTGGANTHGHTGVASHTHTATGTHSHTGGTGGASDTNMTGVGQHSVSNTGHSHSVTSVSNVTATWNNATINADSSNNEPEYRTVAYIQLIKPNTGGAFLYNFM